GLLRAVGADKVQAAGPRHDQVLEDDRWVGAQRRGHGLVRGGAEVELDVALDGQDPPDGLADDGLVVDQEHDPGPQRHCRRVRACGGGHAGLRAGWRWAGHLALISAPMDWAGRTFTAAPISAAAPGMPQTTLDSLSWAMVNHPAARRDARPAAPSRP